MTPNDSLENITKPAIKRMAKEAGVQRLSEDTYDHIREIIYIFLYSLLEKCIAFAVLNKRKTWIKRDIIASLRVMGDGYRLSDEFIKKKPTTSTKSMKKTVRQKNNKLFIPCLPFERFAGMIANQIASTRPHFSKDFFNTIQMVTVIYTTEVLQKANLIAQTNKRPTLMVKDLSLVQQILD